ncbi:MAG: hypothetical protein IRZ28_21855 [Steroidobacteraceae bacterium]|nr:hypothetical protein [Steroidobacteraceae bacterium]
MSVFRAAAVIIGMVLGLAWVGQTFFSGRSTPKSDPNITEILKERLKEQKSASVLSERIATRDGGVVVSPEAEAEFQKLTLPKWKYASENDEMRGVTNRWAELESESILQLPFPYNGGSRLQITLRSRPKLDGESVMISLSKGQLSCSSYDGCKVTAKFDDGPILNYKANPAREMSNLVFITDKKGFTGRLRKAQQVILEVYVWQHGPARFTFQPAGLEW